MSVGGWMAVAGALNLVVAPTPPADELHAPIDAPTGSDGAGATSAATKSAIGRAETLYRRGEAKFETAQYREAIDLWTRAYELVPTEPATAAIKVLLIYNVATAQQRAFDIDRDVVHLRQAKILLARYAQSIPSLLGDSDEAATERSKVDRRLVELDRQIAATERTAAPVREPRAPLPAPAARDPKPTAPKNRPLIVAGATVLGLGAAAFAIMATGLGVGARANRDVPDDLQTRRTQFDRGRTGNAMAWAGGAIGGVLFVTGAALLGTGLKRRARSVAFAPGPTGLSAVGRF